MKTDLFDFLLPKSCIALRPARPRDSARLLVVRPSGALEHHHVKDLPKLLKSGDILSINDSRVVPSLLRGLRPSRQAGTPDVPVEVNLHMPAGENRYETFAKPARRLRAGDILRFPLGLQAEVLSRSGREATLAFNRAGAALDAAILAAGEMPLPPYILSQRPLDQQDSIDYQTVFADEPGSVAAPTAGLHFTPQLLEQLGAAGVEIARTTLHVGAGTFLPVTAENTRDHRMHAERAHVTEQTAARLNRARAAGGRIVATGTTALRTLESATEADDRVRAFEDKTDIFITPGYRFRAVDVLLTNFHLPRSTLFMLVCAFMGIDVMQAAYAEAIRTGYRFYSYGDACLLFRSP